MIFDALGHRKKYYVNDIANYVSKNGAMSRKEFFRTVYPFLLGFKIFQKRSPHVFYDRKAHWNLMQGLTSEFRERLKKWNTLPNTWANLFTKIRSVDD